MRFDSILATEDLTNVELAPQGVDYLEDGDGVLPGDCLPVEDGGVVEAEEAAIPPNASRG